MAPDSSFAIVFVAAVAFSFHKKHQDQSHPALADNCMTSFAAEKATRRCNRNTAAVVGRSCIAPARSHCTAVAGCNRIKHILAATVGRVLFDLLACNPGRRGLHLGKRAAAFSAQATSCDRRSRPLRSHHLRMFFAAACWAALSCRKIHPS